MYALQEWQAFYLLLILLSGGMEFIMRFVLERILMMMINYNMINCHYYFIYCYCYIIIITPSRLSIIFSLIYYRTCNL